MKTIILNEFFINQKVAKNLPIRSDTESHCGNGVPLNFSLITEFCPLHVMGPLSSEPPVWEGSKLYIHAFIFYRKESVEGVINVVIIQSFEISNSQTYMYLLEF